MNASAATTEKPIAEFRIESSRPTRCLGTGTFAQDRTLTSENENLAAIFSAELFAEILSGREKSRRREITKKVTDFGVRPG